MPLILGWREITLRLVCTVVAGTLIGINRGERGRAAGLRTTLLVCLAASVAMLQTNLLLNMRGKTGDSFAVMDLMRLPLGILSGIGFIGAGAIIRRGDRVMGVTTAATLWFVTVLGLCFGGGQIGLGLVALALSLIILWGMKSPELHLNQEHHAILELKVAEEGPTHQNVRNVLEGAGFKIKLFDIVHSRQPASRTICAQVQWRAPHDDIDPPAFVEQWARDPSVMDVHWEPAEGGKEPSSSGGGK